MAYYGILLSFQAQHEAMHAIFMHNMLRRDLDDSLKQLLVICGHQTSSFKCHSFRIGAATDAALKGEYYAQIRAAGRWTSVEFWEI